MLLGIIPVPRVKKIIEPNPENVQPKVASVQRNIAKTSVDLESDIEAKFQELTPDQTCMENIQQAFIDISKDINLILKNVKIQIVPYGSATNGLALRGDSDLDITIVCEKVDFDSSLDCEALFYKCELRAL